MTRALLTATLALAATTLAAPPKAPSLEPGAKAPDFSLPGVDGKTYTLANFADKDALAVLFTCNHCPTAQAYEDRVKQIGADYADKSFALVAISPNDPLAVRPDELGYSVFGDTFEDMKRHAEDNGFTFPYLYDGETQATSLAYGVKATPHVYLFDKERVLRYVGSIDDNEKGKTITKRYLRDAIDAVLAGKEVAEAKTRVFGCSTKWADKRAGAVQAEAAWKALPVTLEKIDAAGVKALAANKTDKLRLINVWATWCGPCVAEFPALVEISRRYERREFDLITICTDELENEAKVLRFLTEEHAAVPPRGAEAVKAEGRGTNNYLFSGTDKNALADALDPAWEGPLPHTVLIAPGGDVLHRWTGEIDPAAVRTAIVEFVGRTY
jgi:thiol-disulfide isomerase/thioredoxin